MAQLIVILDASHRSPIQVPSAKDLYHVSLNLPELDFTDAEIELHAGTMVKMLLQCMKET